MNDDGGDIRRDQLYRNTDKGMLAGVCAGIADFFGFSLPATRVLVAIGMFMFPFLLVVYILLAVLLPRKPVGRRTDREESLQRRVRAEPHATLRAVRHRFRDLDRRLQRLEKYVTSGRFRLDREFESLRD